MNDELDEGLVESQDEFDEFSQKASLGDIIKNSPLAKVGIVIAVLAVVGIVMMFFGGDAIEQEDSMIPKGSEVTSVPGASDKVSPAYTKAVEDQNEADLERAILEGGSAIPVPIETTDVRLSIPEVEEEAEDPLHRWRIIQEERVERQMQAKEAEIEPVTVLNAEKQNEAIEEMASLMTEQMSSILGKTTEDKTFNSKTLISYSGGGDGSSGGVGSYGGGRGGNDNSSIDSFSEEEKSNDIIIAGGSIYYGQLLLEANSDIPSVVLAQMVSGPLNGWKLIGKFKLEEDIRMLTINFRSAINKEGRQYRIRAIMLDPDTTLAAMRSKINNRYIRRIVLPAAAKFITGFADAMAESGRTSISVAGSSGGAVQSTAAKTDKQQVATGVADAASDVGDIIEDLGDVPMQVIIEAGTPIGIFFTRSVRERDESRGGGGGGI